MSILRRKKIDTSSIENNSQEQWPSQNTEGELAIDAYETDKEFVIQSPIAGVSAKDLDISADDDMLIIKGQREKPANGDEANYFHQECFWGPFLKKIILPDKVKIGQAKATVKDGILTLRIPKAAKQPTKKISIKDS